ncbi:transcriptional regulator [Sphingomonas panacis]|uniref:Transcriptional regulator n=1 Tax=Sphingomonas panacis TaxID=1560345 RepID=A0A1B3ZCX2_9SPHN|nr:transcriptional regulator [Sphingomonas panacis]
MRIWVLDGRYKNAEERQAIDQEAARRFLEARTLDTPDAWNAVYAWIAEDPARGFAFAQAESAWEFAERLTEVAPSVGPEEIAGPAGRFEAFFDRRMVAGMVAAMLIATAGTIGLQKWSAVERLHTAVGQEKSYRLDDGSIVHLNTDSTVEVAMRDKERLVHLLKGEARFDVAHNTQRPFIVQAGDATVRAVGTAFAVRLRNDLTELTVIEGKVAVHEGAAPTQMVGAGTAAAIRSGTVSMTALLPDQIAQRTAWQEGVIQFDGETLAQAVEEFNRYRTAPLVIGDPQIASLRVGGTFKAGSSDQFVTALSQSFDVRSVSGKDNSIILLPAENRSPDSASAGRDR